MADLQQAMQALRNAHNAGDVEAATRLAGIVRKLQSEPQQPSGGAGPAQSLRELYTSRDAAIEPREFKRTLPGQVGEVFRGIPRGAVGLLETAGIGASALLPEQAEEAVRGGIERVAEAASSPFQPKAGYEDALLGKLGEGLGSTGPFLAAGLLRSLLLRGATGLGLGTATGAGEARTRAEEAGATEEERATATALGAAPGALEAYPPFAILSRFRKAVGPDNATAIVDRLRRVATSAGEEGLQEAASNIAQNLIAQGVYDPEQGAFTNTGESFGLGAGVGGLISALVELGIRDRGRGAPDQVLDVLEGGEEKPAPGGVSPAVAEAAAPPQAPVAPTETELTLDEILSEGAQGRAARDADTFYPRSDLDREANRGRGRIRELEDDIIGDLTRVEPTPETPQTFESALDAELAERSQQKARQDQEQAQRDQEARAGQDSARRQSIADIEAELAADMKKGVEPVTPTAVTPTETTPPSTPPPPPTTPMQFGSEKAANAAARQIATELGLDISDGDLAALVKPIIRFALPRREPAIREALQKMVPAATATTPTATTPTAPNIKERAAGIKFTGKQGYASNESVSASLREIEQDDDIALEFEDRVGSVLLQGIDRTAGGKKGRATAVLKEITSWADANNKPLVLMPSGQIEGSKDALKSWYERNGFVVQPDGAMVRQPTAPVASVTTTSTSPLSAADFERAVNSRIDRLSNSVVRQLLTDNDIDFITGKEKERLRELRPVEKAILVNEVLDDDLQIEIPGTFEEKINMSLDTPKRTINVDGVERPTTNSNGQSIHPTQEGLRNFWRWFGNSKVVDAEGRPLVLYKGLENEMEGDAVRSSDWGTLGEGIYLTSDSKAASNFATGVRADVIEPKMQGNVLPVYAKLSSPFSDSFFVGNKDWQEWAASVIRNGEDPTFTSWPVYAKQKWMSSSTPQQLLDIHNKLMQHTATIEDIVFLEGHSLSPWGSEILQKVKEHGGFDGVVMPKSRKGYDEYVPYSSTQVKSAIGNTGAFDPSSGKINQAQGASSYSTDLFPYIKDFDSALDAIVKYAANPAQREIAEKLAARIEQLKQLGFTFSLEVTREGYQITGGARGTSTLKSAGLGGNTSVVIRLNHPSNGANSGTGWEVVAHEMAHAATQAQLTYAPQGTAAVQLRALFNDVVRHFNQRVKEGNLTEFEKRIYNNPNGALRDPDELLAWGLTNAEMQQWLDSIKSKNGSFLSRLFDLVASALGFSNNDTALSELLSVTDNLLTESLTPYVETANTRGLSFGRQENLTNHPDWALRNSEGRPIVWSAPDAALIEAQTLRGNTIYLLSTPQGTTRVDVSAYTGNALPSARLKLIQKIAAGFSKTSPSIDKTAQAAESAILDDTPANNTKFLKTQGEGLNSTSKPMRSKPVRDAVAKVMGTESGSATAKAGRTVLTWGLPLPALNDYVQSYMSKGDYKPFADAMKRFTETAVKFEGAMREFVDGITAQITRMGDWKRANADKYEAFTNLYFGASHARVDLTKPESDYANNPEKLSAYRRLMKDFVAIGPSGQAIYRQMRAIHNRQFKQISQQVFDRVYSDTKDKGMATRVRDAFVAQMREKGPLEGYAPMLRPSGKHMLKYVIKGEDAFEIFTNPNDQKAREQQLLAEGVRREDIKPFLGDNLREFDGIVPSSFLGQLVGTLKEVKVDDATRDALIESVMTLGIAMSPPNSVLERLASRKEVAGYVRDPFWAFQEGTMGLGRKLINMEYGAKLNNEKNNMRETRKNIGADPTAASIMEEVEKRAKYAANPSQSWWSNLFTTATYGWTLGFNVSSAIVDMSSLALVTAPYLTQTYGWGKTHRAMMNAAKDIMGMGTSSNVETLVTQGLEGAELQEVLKTLGTKERDMVNRKTLPSMLNIDFNDPAQQQKYGYLKPLVDKLREAGHSERYSEVSESAEFGESNLLSKWAARMGFMMNASERFKREIGLKSAYDLALSKVGANPTPEQMADAAQKAMEMSLLLNGGSTAVTGAGFQQNDIARIAFMYRRFAALQLYLQTKTAYDATLNDDPVVKAAARKFAAYTMLTSAAFVGVKGMPMMGAVAGLWAMYGALFGEEDEDNSLDNFLRTNLDPILVEGIPNILFNANVAGRMEMTNLLIRDSNLPNDATLADIIMAHFGGPAYGSASRAIRGAGLIADGEIQRGVENMLPVSISNLFKSGRFLTEGAIETMRGDTVVEVNPFGALAQGLGFAPADYARAMDFNIGQSNAERRIYEKRTGLYEAVYTAYRVGDTGGVAQAMQAIIEFNQRYPEFAITSQGLKQSISGRDRNTQQMVMGRLPSERTRGVTLENAEDWGF